VRRRQDAKGQASGIGRIEKNTSEVFSPTGLNGRSKTCESSLIRVLDPEKVRSSKTSFKEVFFMRCARRTKQKQPPVWAAAAVEIASASYSLLIIA